MQLTYRGHAYNTSVPSIEATQTQETITFLGCQAKVKRFSIQQRPQSQVDLTYRGVRYSR